VDAPRRLDPVVALGALLALLGLALLVRGLSTGVPVVFWGTAEEREARERGRELIAVAALVLAVAGGVLWLRGLLPHGAAVAAAGIVPAALTFLFPEAGWAWFGLLGLAPVALAAVLVALAR
jgi:hypothetical protein